MRELKYSLKRKFTDLSVLPDTLPAKLFHIHSEEGIKSRAFELGEDIIIDLHVPSDSGEIIASMDIYNADISRCIVSLQGCWNDRYSDTAVYRFSICSHTLPIGLYFLKLRLRCGSKELYSSLVLGDSIVFSENRCGRCPQLSIFDFNYPDPKSIRDGVIYHIFVDRFLRSSKRLPVKSDSIVLDGEWREIPEYPLYPGEPIKNNTFMRGDLYGIIEKLPYLSSLGVRAIYLSPIFDSPSNHRYDTSDYMKVDPSIGGDKALSELIEAASAYSIKIILDAVFNHTGADSIYFNKYSRFDSCGAFNSEDSEYYSWYDFSEFPDKYTCWWGIEILPRINPDNKMCREFFVGKRGVIEKYSSMGVYGYRLDVADELSDDFISKIKAKASAEGESIVYGEVWEDASNKCAYSKMKSYYNGKELDGVMNYPLRNGIIDFVLHRGSEKLRYALNEVMLNAPDRIMHTQMNILGSHDTERILTVLGSEIPFDSPAEMLVHSRLNEDELRCAIECLKMAYTMLATLPGIPTVYYGDEAGLQGYRDPFNRMPFPWGSENADILNHYKTIGAIRRRYSCLSDGVFNCNYLDEHLFVYSRINKNERIIMLINNADESLTIDFSVDVLNLITTQKAKDYVVPPYSAEIYLCDIGVTAKFRKHKL